MYHVMTIAAAAPAVGVIAYHKLPIIFIVDTCTCCFDQLFVIHITTYLIQILCIYAIHVSCNAK